MHHAECVMFNLDNRFCTFGLELGQKGCLIIAIFNISHNCPSSLCSTVQRGGVIFEKKITLDLLCQIVFRPQFQNISFYSCFSPRSNLIAAWYVQEEAMSHLFILNFRLKRTSNIIFFFLWPGPNRCFAHYMVAYKNI